MLNVDVRLHFPGFTLAVTEDFPLSGVTAIFGRSGSGKSTLLRIIAGLETRAAGRVAMAGEIWQDGPRHVPPERRGVGYVFQDARLFPHLSVRGNLDFALRRARGLGGPGLDEVAAALDLSPLLDRRPAALSGGERQRVAMGRALLTAPKVLLMDEPLAALDEARKAEILPYLERLRDETRVPILYVSHAAAEVARLANTLVLIDAGRVTRAGPAAELLSDPATAGRFGLRDAGAILTLRIAAQDPDGLTRLDGPTGPLWLPRIDGPPGTTLRVRILAQDVMLALTPPVGISALNVLPATVRQVRPGEGPGTLVQLALGDSLILSRITRRSAEALNLAPGLGLYAVIKAVSVAPQDIGDTQVP
ncbi:MAG: molybdenum ABC transporter ATP-binding protein [Gemmobacter sp.]